MNAYFDPNYGADIDGNRGIPQWDYETDSSDDEHILDHLHDLLKEFDPILESMPEVVEIPFINPITEDDVVLDITTEPYLDELMVYKVITSENYEAVVSSLVNRNKSLALKLSLYLIEQLSKKH